VKTAVRTVAWQRALRAAGRLLGSSRGVDRLLAAAAGLIAQPRTSVGGLRGDAATLIRMVRETLRGGYRRLPKRTVIAMIAGLVYFVSPLDLIPDVLPLLGFVDDAAVLFWVVRQVRRDLDDFRAWEREWGGAVDVEARPADPEALPPGD
jgi:uncharacterized membrane protein YkvA (DUF1232 family)